MLDKILQKKLYAAVKREGMDLNDPVIQDKITVRRIQIEEMILAMIESQTKHCGCGSPKGPGEIEHK